MVSEQPWACWPPAAPACFPELWRSRGTLPGFFFAGAAAGDSCALSRAASGFAGRATSADSRAIGLAGLDPAGLTDGFESSVCALASDFVALVAASSPGSSLRAGADVAGFARTAGGGRVSIVKGCLAAGGFPGDAAFGLAARSAARSAAGASPGPGTAVLGTAGFGAATSERDGVASLGFPPRGSLAKGLSRMGSSSGIPPSSPSNSVGSSVSADAS